jgi:hypothetical protein
VALIAGDSRKAWESLSGVDSTRQAAVPYIVTMTPSNTSNQVVARVAIRHKS